MHNFPTFRKYRVSVRQVEWHYLSDALPCVLAVVGESELEELFISGLIASRRSVECENIRLSYVSAKEDAMRERCVSVKVYRSHSNLMPLSHTI